MIKKGKEYTTFGDTSRVRVVEVFTKGEKEGGKEKRMVTVADLRPPGGWQTIPAGRFEQLYSERVEGIEIEEIEITGKWKKVKVTEDKWKKQKLNKWAPENQKE